MIRARPRSAPTMHVVITGGAGFLGRRLARSLLARGTLTDAAGATRPISGLTLLDVVAPTGLAADPRLRVVVGDLADERVIAEALRDDTQSVFHLAAVVSGEAEANFDLGMRVNVDATRHLLMACRAQKSAAKVLFASSLAVFGGTLPDPVTDDAPVMPQTSYGTQKTIGSGFLRGSLNLRSTVKGVATCELGSSSDVCIAAPRAVLRSCEHTLMTMR